MFTFYNLGNKYAQREILWRYLSSLWCFNVFRRTTHRSSFAVQVALTLESVQTLMKSIYYGSTVRRMVKRVVSSCDMMLRAQNNFPEDETWLRFNLSRVSTKLSSKFLRNLLNITLCNELFYCFIKCDERGTCWRNSVSVTKQNNLHTQLLQFCCLRKPNWKLITVHKFAA